MPPERRLRTKAGPPELDLATVLRALGDPVRLAIIQLLADGASRVTGQIASALDLPASTCSYHLKQLLEAGVTECQTQGNARIPVLRRAVLEERFPGLIAILIG